MIKSGGIDRGQRGTAFEAWDCLKKAHDLVGAQHHWQLARLTGIRDALRYRGLAKRHAIEEPQRADDLVQRRPRDPRCNQMNLEGVNIFQAQMIRRAKIPAQRRYAAEVRLLRRRRQIADRHVLDHAAAKRAHLSHRKTSCLKGWASTPTILSDRRRLLRPPSTAAIAASFNPDPLS